MKGSARVREAAVLALLILAAAWYHDFTWLALPEKNDAGRFDSHALSFFLAGLSLLMLWLPRWLRLPGLILLWLPLIVLAPVNWWHYAFYKDVVVSSSFFYGASALEGTKALFDLGNVWAALGGASLVAVLLIGAYLLSARARAGLLTGVFALAFFVQAGAQWVSFAAEDNRDIPVIGSAPVMAMLRSFLPSPPDIEERHLRALHRARPDLATEAPSDLFPLYRPESQTTRPKNEKNVIVILLESVRSAETGLYGSSTLTPNLDRIAHEGLYITDFYSNTTQTVRAETSILCGVLDFNRGAPFSEYSQKMRTWCLPEILSEVGYETHWFHGFERDFFDRGTYLPDIGFQHIHDRAVVAESLEKPKHLGWGIADESVMQYAVAQLKKARKPFFAEILTLSNHFPFDWDWERVGHAGLSGSNTSMYGNYQKGVKYTDYALGVFWDAFRESGLSSDTAVFILGDHGVWVFDEDVHESLSLMGRFEQYYRVPFVAWLPEGKAGVMDRVASQVDVAPTILSYLGMSAPNAFLGVDVFSPKDSRAIPFAVMIQNGRTSARLGDAHCYPATLACPVDSLDAYQRCQDGEQLSPKLTCVVPTDAAQMLFATEHDYEEVDQDVAWLNDLSDYMDTALLVGFVPGLASSRLRAQADKEGEEVIR